MAGKMRRRARAWRECAGQCDAAYEADVSRLVARLEQSGFATSVEVGVVPPETLGSVLAASDVLVLPYRSHFGGSGFLGTAFDFPGLTVTRLASGLPMGGDLEFADELTLGRALSGRRTL